MSFKGSWADINLGNAGLISDLPSGELPMNALLKSQNIDYAPGFLQKAPGAIVYNRSGALTGGIVGLLDYWYDVLTQRLFAATTDGKLWKDYGDGTFNNMTPIASGLGTLNNSCSFVVGGNESAGNPKKIFFFSGGISQIQVISGDNATAARITLPAADWANPTISTNQTSNFPKFGMVHRGRLWVFAKSVAYASSTTNHEDFQTAMAILVNNVGPGEGGDIIGAFVYKGQMLVFKQGDYVYQLVDTDVTSTNWYFTKFAEGFGIASIHGSTQVLDDLIVGNVTGTLTSYKATQAYGNFTQADLYKQAKVSTFFRQHSCPAGIPTMQACYYPEKGRGFFTSKSAFFTYNNQLTVLDVSDPANARFGLWSHYQADAITLRRDINNVLRPMFGGTSGNVMLGDRETRAVAGAAYTAEFRTAYTDFRQLQPDLAVKEKQYDFLSCTFTPDGNHNLSVDVWIDGRFSETINFTQTIDTNYLGSFKLGSSILGSEDEQTIILPLHGKGRRISLRGYNANAYESFKVSQLSIGFRILGEDATRAF